MGRSRAARIPHTEFRDPLYFGAYHRYPFQRLRRPIGRPDDAHHYKELFENKSKVHSTRAVREGRTGQIEGDIAIGHKRNFALRFWTCFRNAMRPKSR